MFKERFAKTNFFDRSSANAGMCVKSRWLKAGIPVLNNRDEVLESLLLRIGLKRHSEGGVQRPFTCDATWACLPNCYSIVFGPGDLVTNGAHTDNECVQLGVLARYALRIRDIVLAFASLTNRSS